MSEFGPRYQAVTSENVHDIPIDAGIALARIGQIRPFGFSKFGKLPYLLAVVGNRSIKTEIGLAGLPGFIPTPETTDYQATDLVTRFSFQYYKAVEDGYQEEDLRDVEMVPFDTTIAYGVLLPDHEGETPTWYLRGRHVGFTTEGENYRLVAGPRIEQPRYKNFSLARIVNGPLGDPLYDAAFREQMGIAEIPRTGITIDQEDALVDSSIDR